MYSSASYLALCQKLKEAGLVCTFDGGERLGRGYADLGTEEFLLLPSKKLLSLMSGKVTEFPAGHEHFFFSIPTNDELVLALRASGNQIESLVYKDQRDWVLRCGVAQSAFEVSARSLQEALAQGLLKALRGKESKLC